MKKVWPLLGEKLHVHACVLHILEETPVAEVHSTAQIDLMNTAFGLSLIILPTEVRKPEGCHALPAANGSSGPAGDLKSLGYGQRFHGVMFACANIIMEFRAATLA